MILLQESIPKKVPGETSIIMNCEYDSRIVEVMHSCDSAVYNKKDKSWEFPLTSLSKALDGLCKIDEVRLKIMDNLEQGQNEVDLKTTFKTAPFKYQLDGIKYGLSHDKFMLLDAPGLGKSLQAIYIAQELKEREGLNHCLIICGINTLKSNWKQEIEKHSNLSCRILGEFTTKTGKVKIGGIKERLNQLRNNIDEFFVITNIETLRNSDIVKEIEKGCNKFEIILFDEVHLAKSPTSEQGSNLLKLKSARHKIAMTGTLLLNSPLDCYVPLKWIDAEKSNYSTFRYYYGNYGGPFGNQLLGYKNLDVLKQQIEDNSIRRTKDLLDLPEKTLINELVDMGDSQKNFYDNIVNGIVGQVDKVHLSTANLLSMVCRLRQATALPDILTTEKIPSAKIDRCYELVSQIVENGNNVVVFCTFKDCATRIYEMCNGFGALLCTGDVPDDLIRQNIKSFQEDDSIKVMVATWQKMGTGVTLTSANYAVFIDTPWTNGVFEQAQDRVHRIGSKQPVFIYNLICKDTIDERVKQIVSTKGSLSNYVIDDDTSDEVINSLRQYIKELQ